MFPGHPSIHSSFSSAGRSVAVRVACGGGLSSGPSGVYMRLSLFVLCNVTVDHAGYRQWAETYKVSPGPKSTSSASTTTPYPTLTKLELPATEHRRSSITLTYTLNLLGSTTTKHTIKCNSVPPEPHSSIPTNRRTGSFSRDIVRGLTRAHSARPARLALLDLCGLGNGGERRGVGRGASSSSYRGGRTSRSRHGSW